MQSSTSHGSWRPSPASATSPDPRSYLPYDMYGVVGEGRGDVKKFNFNERDNIRDIGSYDLYSVDGNVWKVEQTSPVLLRTLDIGFEKERLACDNLM